MEVKLSDLTKKVKEIFYDEDSFKDKDDKVRFMLV